MRSALLFAAMAAGACAKAIEKDVYVTDWTTTTVTETVTAWPTSTAATQVLVKEDTIDSQPSVPTDNALPTVDLSKKSTVTESAPQEAAAATQDAVEQAPAPTAGATTWYSTSYWTEGGAAATTEAPTSLATTTSAASTATPTNAYQQAILYNHNVHRSNHSANSVTWSGSLESSARTLAAKCVYQHDTSIDGGGYGQNIGYGVEEASIGEMITNLMYNDEMMYFAELYGTASPDMTNFDAWGHFSQIVWKGTKEVGCATVVCNSLGNAGGSNVPFTVCNYSPPGNYDGEYATNVLAPQGAAIYTA
ncbi:hypothetical protein N7467_003626 [Penicillium canescens]|nr:hypothetical protein N7467_003626 [Penicillium canescens]